MKVYSRMVWLLLGVFLISACAPSSTSTLEAVTTEPQPTLAEKYHSLDTRTGITEIDDVLAAVESNDPQKLRELFSYSTIACRTVHALGGPPPCREGEAEGTLVEVLPILGAEGGHLRKDEISNWTALDVTRLYAVYRVSNSAFSAEYYPKGDYGVILVGAENSTNTVLQIKEAASSGLIISSIIRHSLISLGAMQQK